RAVCWAGPWSRRRSSSASPAKPRKMRGTEDLMRQIRPLAGPERAKMENLPNYLLVRVSLLLDHIFRYSLWSVCRSLRIAAAAARRARAWRGGSRKQPPRPALEPEPQIDFAPVGVVGRDGTGVARVQLAEGHRVQVRQGEQPRGPTGECTG